MKFLECFKYFSREDKRNVMKAKSFYIVSLEVKVHNVHEAFIGNFEMGA